MTRILASFDREVSHLRSIVADPIHLNDKSRQMLDVIEHFEAVVQLSFEFKNALSEIDHLNPNRSVQPPT